MDAEKLTKLKETLATFETLFSSIKELITEAENGDRFDIDEVADTVRGIKDTMENIGSSLDEAESNINSAKSDIDEAIRDAQRLLRTLEEAKNS